MKNSERRVMKRLCVCVLLTMLTTAAWAEHVSESEAMQKAQAFLTERGHWQAKPHRILRTAMKGRRARAQVPTECAYYVFNVSDDCGFVIVSGDDRAPAILGYADSGRIVEDSLPEGLRCLLEDYAVQMGSIERAPKRAPAVARASITPLIQTHWNQGAPYNNNCPTIGGVRAVTGCVATAMAQVMNYHQWPVSATMAVPGYSTDTKDAEEHSVTLNLSELPTTSFNWGAMTLSYKASATGEAAEAVAELMQYCGWAVRMMYGLNVNGGSSAYNVSVAEGLKDFFDYDSGVHDIFRACYSYSDWINTLYAELAANRPIVMGGQSAGGGHSFVCDGYDSDDFFHFNWGWGGSSDGYYRMAVLQPWEQGIGGSSTLDGFNFGQEAVIGIQKPAEGTKAYGLSLEGLRLSGKDAARSSKTFTRNAKTGGFDINYYLSLWSYKFGTHDYDILVELCDESYTLRQSLVTINASYPFNTNIYASDTMHISQTISDGTYYIKVLCRPQVTAEPAYDDAWIKAAPWQECSHNESFQLTAVISGDKLTLTVPQPANTTPICSAITVTGDQLVGSEQKVKASITGGAGDYHGDLYLYVNNELIMGKTVDIAAGASGDVSFAYTPSEAGENVLAITKAKSTAETYVLRSKTITIGASDITNSQELSLTYNVTNLSDGKLYGNAMRVTATVTNPDTEHRYGGTVNCSLRMYNNAEDAAGDFVDANVHSEKVTIATNGSVSIDFAFEGLDPTKFYRLRFSYTKGSDTVGDWVSDPYAMGAGYALYASDGSTTITSSTSSIVAGNAAYVDLKAISNFNGYTITASSNPNCVYMLTDGVETPEELAGKNIVRNGTAASITLTDGYDFYTPVTFTATAISYTRTFTLAAGGTSGWNTLFLPFKPSSITCEDIGSVDWFHSVDDRGKNFWLRTFTGDEGSAAIFDFVEGEMEANTPYIIAVPDNRWGELWQMTGKAVTFSATNASIAAMAESSLNGNSYKFCGSTVTNALSEVYALNADGSSFVKQSSTSVPAFRAWISAASISSLSLPALTISSPESTGIEEVEGFKGSRVQGGEIYNLAGQRVDGSRLKVNGSRLKSGIYIQNGKKFIVK